MASHVPTSVGYNVEYSSRKDTMDMVMDKPQRRTVRYSGYDYSMHGAYFITVCAERHRPFFGTIENNQMELNWVGRIVEREWLRIAQLRNNVALDEFIVMPNHFHAVVIVRPNETNAVVTHANAAGQDRTFGKPQSGSLAMIVGSFKSAVTRAVNRERERRHQAPVRVWQNRFYDRIIRDEKELLHTRRYIVENPQNWPKDEYS